MSDLQTFLADLASGEPVPGGGSAAALEAAIGASLVAMVANLTIGRKRYEAVQAQAGEILDRALVLRDRAYQLIEEDTEAFRRVSAAMALPRAGEEEKVARRAALQEALKRAAEPPLDTMQVAVDVMRLAADLAGIGNRSAISDVGVAALSARAAFQAARLNVEINVAGVADEEWTAVTRGRLDSLGDLDGLERTVMDDVMRAIRGGE